jgi:transcriptional regulator
MAVKTTKMTGKGKMIKPKRGSKAPEILALAARPELSQAEIAKLVDTSEANISRTLTRYGIERTTVDEFISHKVRILSGIQEKILQELSKRSFEKESAHTLTVDAGIIQDKIRDIIHGKSGNSGVNVNINIGDPTKTIDVTDT